MESPDMRGSFVITSTVVLALLVLTGAGPQPIFAHTPDVGTDWIHQVERSLKTAALIGGARHAKRHRIERSVHDISAALEFAWKASQREDREQAMHHTRQALRLIERSVDRGYFRLEEVELVYDLIEQHLPQAGL